MPSITLRQAILIALTPVATHTAFAKDDITATSIVDLGQEVVMVARIATPLTQTPASVNIISHHEITTNPARNLADVIQSDASVYLKQNGGIGQGANLTIRGTNPSHTLLLKDGVRLNTPNTMTPIYPESLDLTDASHVEIVKGPASVQYGSDAIGGVVQIVTAKPTQTGISVTGIAGEHDSYKAIVKGDVVANGFYASLGGQRMETDGTRIFNNQGRHKAAGYEQKGYHAKLGYAHEDKFDVNIAHSHNEGVNEYSTDSGQSIDAERAFKNSQSKLQASFNINNQLKLSAHIAQAKDEQNYIEPWATNAFHTDYRELDVNARYHVAANQNILMGITKNTSQYQDTFAYQGAREIGSTGYYLQHQYDNDKLNTQVGVRLEDNDNFGTHTVGQAAARYHITPSTSVFANIGSAFRAPSLNELYYDATFGNFITRGNTALQPEKSISYELGVHHEMANGLSVSLAGFSTDVKNLIGTASSFDAATNTTTSTYQNIGKARFIGGELQAAYQLDDYYAKAGYSYTETENKRTGNEIPYRAKHTGTLSLGYDDGVVGVSTAAVARTGSYTDHANTIKVPGYVTLDVNAHWQVNPQVKLFTNIQNLTNSEHRLVDNAGNWYVNGGRQANIGATFSY